MGAWCGDVRGVRAQGACAPIGGHTGSAWPAQGEVSHRCPCCLAVVKGKLGNEMHPVSNAFLPFSTLLSRLSFGVNKKQSPTKSHWRLCARWADGSQGHSGASMGLAVDTGNRVSKVAAKKGWLHFNDSSFLGRLEGRSRKGAIARKPPPPLSCTVPAWGPGGGQRYHHHQELVSRQIPEVDNRRQCRKAGTSRPVMTSDTVHEQGCLGSTECSSPVLTQAASGSLIFRSVPHSRGFGMKPPYQKKKTLGKDFLWRMPAPAWEGRQQAVVTVVSSGTTVPLSHSTQ